MNAHPSTARHIPTAYCDTSVFGGVYDAEFARPSLAFLGLLRTGAVHVVISAVVDREIHDEGTPGTVVTEYAKYRDYCRIAEVTEECLRLQDSYLSAGILTPKWEDDALHVAIATVSRYDMIVSWNFRHIVNFRKIPLYSAVNVLHGYQPIRIHSPLEVVADGND